jgi:hypothetical protein
MCSACIDQIGIRYWSEDFARVARGAILRLLLDWVPQGNRQRAGELCGPELGVDGMGCLNFQQLVFQQDHDLVATAKGCNLRQTSAGHRHGHDRSVAIDGVPGGREVPLPSLSLRRLLAGGGRELNWWG